MRVDFYRLSREDAGKLATQLARKSLAAGHRVLLVAQGEERLQELSGRLWQDASGSFLANGLAGGDDDHRQPILLAGQVEPANGADVLLLADGVWRDPADRFERVMLLFDESTIAGARTCWSQLGENRACDRHFWQQDADGRWVEGP